MHCSENLKHIFPVMKLRCLIPNFYIHSCVWVRFIYFQDWSYLESFFLYCLRELSAQLQERRERQGTAAKQGLAASGSPCPPLVSCGWAESSHKWLTCKFSMWKIIDHKWKQSILVVNFLFVLRVNEIANRTFILDSHLPSISSVQYSGGHHSC